MQKGVFPVLVFLCIIMMGCQPDSKENQDEIALLLAQAESAHALGRPDWVRYFLEAALAVEGDLPLAWSQLGDANLAGFEGSVFKGIEAYEKALLLNPDLTSTRISLAEALLRQGKTTEVLEVLKPLNEHAEVLTLAAQAIKQNDPKGAWTRITRAIDLAAVGEKPHFEAAEIARLLGDWQAVFVQADLARKDLPWKASAAYLVATAQAQLGNQEAQQKAHENFQLLQKYLAIKGNSKEASAEKLQLMTALKPYWQSSWPRYYANQIYLCIYAGQSEALESAWQQFRTNMDLRLSEKHDLAAALLGGGQTSKMARVMDSLTPEEKVLPTSILLQAQLDFKRQRFQEVENHLSQVIEEDPIAPYYYWLSKAQFWLSKEKEAHENLQQAVALAPWMASYQIALAQSWLAMGNRSEAVACLNNPLIERNARVAAFIRENGLE